MADEERTKCYAVVPVQDVVKVREVIGFRGTQGEAEGFQTLVQTLDAWRDADLEIVECVEEPLFEALVHSALNKRIPRWKD